MQHPAQFTAEALTGLVAAYKQHLDHGLPVAEIRRRTALAGGSTRVLRPAAERKPMLRHWPMTIAHVSLSGQPQGAAERARAWAAAIRCELG